MAFSQGIGWGIGKHARRAIEKAFVFTVDTTLGDGLDNYTLNFTGAGYDIKTSDGQTITGATAATTINFPGPGTYDIKIRGDVSTRTFANDLKLVDIKNWGVLDTPLDDKFVGANSLTTITAPDQPVISSMTRLFNNAQNFAGGISHWDVSNIVSFQRAFYNTSFDEDISSWDMSSATVLQEMFWITPFNNGGQPGIGNWDVSNVTNFYRCFAVTPFNQPIGSWNIKTSGPVRMDYMFSQATAFNQDLNTWDVSSVNDMNHMFQYAGSFNQDLNSWNLASVIGMVNMFENAIAFNGNISSWAFPNVTSFVSLLAGAESFNQDISGWDTSGITTMTSMFRNTYAFNQPIGIWDTSSVTKMNGMFFASAFNQNINNWNVSLVDNMNYMFYNAGAFNQPLGDWDVSSVTDMSYMFRGAGSFNQPIGDWDVSGVTNMNVMFNGASAFNQPLGSWTINSTSPVSMDSMFGSAIAFNQDIGAWDVSQVTTMLSMFYNARDFNNGGSSNINNWNTGNVTNMKEMFWHGGIVSQGSFNQPIGNWNTSNVTTMRSMFYYNTTFDQPIGGWDVSNVTDMNTMFYITIIDQDLSNWNIGSILPNSSNFNWLKRSNYGSPFSTANYDAMLVAYEAQVPPVGLVWDIGDAKYTLGSAAETARTSLINTYGWTITDSGGIANPFTFTVDTALNGGNGSGIAFQLPLVSTSTVNATVDWGDGTVNTVTAYNDPNALHAYASSGVYNISINGTLNGWSCAQAPIHSNDSRKITNISNWGCFDVTETGAFANAINMSGTATDYPAISGGTLASMFSNCYLWNCPMDQWDVSGVTNMSAMFLAARAFNQPLNSWNVSNVGDMGNMFRTTITGAFNQPLNNWDVSNVTEMISMFAFNNSFNGDITSWQLTSNPRIQSMFDGASAFNQPIVNWDIDGIVAATWLFRNASSFDQNLGNWIIRTISSFDWFTGGGLSTGNYDSTLIGWASQAPNIPFNKSANFGSSQYTPGSAAETARTSLINTYGWTITDGGGIAPPPPPKLLDIYSGASAAYSLRDLADASAGNPVVNVRRSSDNATQDFTSTEITDGTLLSFVGNTAADNGYVTTWHDQSGASNNLVQATQANQPKIVSSGVLVKRNLKPAVEFDGLASNFLEQSTALSLTEADGFVIVEAKNYPPTRVNPLVYNESGLWGYSTSPYSNHYSWSDGSIYETFFTTSQVPIATPAVTLAQLNLYNVLSKSSEYSAFLNSGQIFTTATNTVATAGTQRLGASQDSSNNRYYLDGYVSEFIIYPLDQSANRTGIETNINNHYSIFFPYTNQLVASYNFDNDFTDYTGNNPLTPSGGTPPVAGVSGGVVSNCAEFNSTGDYTLTADSDDFSFTDGVADLPFSVSFWANFTSYNAQGVYFLSKRDASTNEEYQIVVSQNIFNVFLFGGGGTANYLRGQLSYTPPIGIWHHYTVTYDGSETSAGIKLYIDGVSQALTYGSVGTYTGMVNGSQDVNIGSQSWNPAAGSFDGKLDEYHIWKDRELTSAEVTDIYTTELAGNSILPADFTTNLVASYNFDADFTDYTGNHPLTSSGNVTAGTAGGVVSNCSDFGGTLSDFLEALDSDDFSFTDGVSDLPFSVSMWLNFDVVANSWFFDKRGTSPNDEYQITYYSGSFAIALASQGGFAAYLNATYAITPVVGTWYHLTWTYDGSGTFAGIKLYIDGVSQALTNISVGTYVGMSNGTAVARFGKFTDGSPFNGKMDETHIWKNRELTAAEVTDIYTTELAGNSILP